MVLILSDVNGEVREMEGEVTHNNKTVKTVKQCPGVKSNLLKRLVLPIPLRSRLLET